MSILRAAVYAAIDSERDYQNNLGPDRTKNHGEGHTVGDYVTMLQAYQAKLVAAWTDNAGDEAALNGIRKIAGIAVRCMEDHGAPQRAGFERPVESATFIGGVQLDITSLSLHERTKLAIALLETMPKAHAGYDHDEARGDAGGGYHQPQLLPVIDGLKCELSRMTTSAYKPGE